MFHWKTTSELLSISPLPGVTWESLFWLPPVAVPTGWEVWVWRTSPSRSPLTSHRSTTLSPVMLLGATWRVTPMSARWPGVTRVSSGQSSPVSLVGILPSLGSLAGREQEEGLRVTTSNRQSLKFGMELIWSALAVLSLGSRMSCQLPFLKEVRLLREEQEMQLCYYRQKKNYIIFSWSLHAKHLLNLLISLYCSALSLHN